MIVGRMGRFVLATSILLASGALASAADPQPAAPTTASSEAARRQFDDAVALHKGGAYDLAVDEWEKFLKNYPNDPLAAAVHNKIPLRVTRDEKGIQSIIPNQRREAK